jgi:hypothetical protein
MVKIRLFSVIVLCLCTLQTYADDFEVLDLGYNMPIDVPWIRVINTNSEWTQFYYYELLPANGLNLDDPCNPNSGVTADCSLPYPRVDFNQYRIIVGGLGIKYQGASKIVVSDVDSTSDSGLNINIIDINPSSDCMAATVINHPTVAVSVRKSDEPFNVTVDEAVLSCQQ